MRTIEVKLPQNKYSINLGEGLIHKIGFFLKSLNINRKVVIITNPAIYELYGEKLGSELGNEGLVPSFVQVPDGEENKSLFQAGKIYTRLSEFKAERMTPILALGGGVIGDLAGFVAATYMRGVPLIQIPTSLLAQVDSSIGGKVAVNHEQLKNNIGTFYQPWMVVTDVTTLKTLPVSELQNGLAEVIKYGIIRDRELFEIVERNVCRLKNADSGLIEEVVFRCAQIKAGLVEKDEKDLGIRNILNYGHTTGHGLETVSDFKLPHGQAVAIGMVAAGLISLKLGYLPKSEYDRIKSVIVAVGLPSTIPGLNIPEVLKAMQHDKKRAAGKLRFVLARHIGEVFITDEVTESIVESALEELNA